MRRDVRRPVWALHVLVVGLALHNLAMSQLWHAGVRGSALSAVSAWKDVLVVVALVAVWWPRRREAFRPATLDWLALAFGLLVVVYGVVPQPLLHGAATHKGVLYGARHDLLPVEAYFLGRGLRLAEDELHRLARTILLTAIGVAAWGLVDVFAISLAWWHRNGTIGWFHDQLGIDTRDNGLSGLPENFVYNAGHAVVYRRLVSTFLSPLATAYLLVVALFAVVALHRRRWALACTPLLFAALLWTHTRAAVLALAGALALLAVVRRRAWPLAALVLVAVVGGVFFHAYGHLGPRTHFTRNELQIQIANAHRHGGAGGSSGGGGSGVASNHEHVSALREGIRAVLDHPQGYGLGNAGVTAQRTGVKVAAGESTYTELGVETGLLGALVFIAWSLALLWRALRARPWVGAALAATLAIGIQTDVIGIPWIAVVVWTLAGDAVSRARSIGPRAPLEPIADVSQS
jgi:hypothetical protein